MVIRNTSQYPTDEVRALVRFAVADLDMRRVCVNVKNDRRGSCGGMAYDGVPFISNAPPSSEYLVSLRIGSPERFPEEHVYPGKTDPRWPRVTLADWREALVHLAAHEGLHVEQMREGVRTSEVRAERFAGRMLKLYRRTTPEGAAR